MLNDGINEGSITMAAICKAEHNRFMQRMETNADPGQQQLVKDDLKQLQSLYREYQVKIEQLQQLAGQYEATRQNIRLKLRAQQKASRHKG